MYTMPPRGEVAADALAEALARRGNRRRLAVFVGVFVASLLVGQAWNLLRHDEYRATSRLQISVPELGAPGAAASAAQATQLQYLDSRPLLAKVARAMTAAGHALPAGDEAALQLQAMLRVTPVAGADVVQLQATGEAPALLAALLNTLPDVVRGELSANQAQAADAILAAARQELARLDTTAARSRAQLERFRGQSGVLSEREDNEAVARNKGLSDALNKAAEKEATAEARLRALTDGAGAGRDGARSRDDPALVALVGRAGQVREELRDMERTYTPDFMAMDPRARALRARLVELERQIVQQASAGQEAALNAAREEVATVRVNIERLRSQLAAARPVLRSVATGFARGKTLEDDLAQVERARRDTLERVARLEADQRRRVPTVTVLEAAGVPAVPFRPDRVGDGLWVLGGSLLLGLLAMGLVELFNRAPIQAQPVGPTTLVMTPPWPAAAPALPGADWARPVLPQPVPAAVLQAPAAPPQRLEQAEAARLLGAAQGTTRFVCAAALMGLTVPELAELRQGDVDVAGERLTVRGAWTRVLPLPAWLAPSLSAPASADALLLHDAAGQPLAEADLRSLLACAALDAGLPQGTALTHEVLRNTCIDWLLGQGLRFADLPARVGRIDADRVAALAGRAAQGPRRQPDEVAWLMPALQTSPSV